MADTRRTSISRRDLDRVELVDGVPEVRRRRDQLATEEPLEIRVTHNGGTHQVAVTMRTPGNDFELAAGFLFAESLIQGADDVSTIRYCLGAEGQPQQYNVVSVDLTEHARFDSSRLDRNFYTTSSCGVCGKASIDAVMGSDYPAVTSELRVPHDLIVSLPERLRAAQTIFDRTGGLHAAALFQATGELSVVREDVGRHNAMDKLVGASLLDREVPLRNSIALVSGRLSFELVQKAARAGIPILAGVSAPSSLAVEFAEAAGMTLIGFLRDARFNLYTGGERLIAGQAQSSALLATVAERS